MKLLILNDVPQMHGASFGGKPVGLPQESFVWPVCSACSAHLHFLGKIPTEHGLLQAFMCQSEGCETWDPDYGANAVIKTLGDNLISISPPEGVTAVSDYEFGATMVDAEPDESYGAAHRRLVENGVPPRHILGCIGGELSPWELDTPVYCDNCEEEMQFVVQLEEGPLDNMAMNFGGGGCAYLFDCSCGGKPKMLWK